MKGWAGLITTGIGILSYFFVPSDPRDTKLLNEQERALAVARLNADAVIRTDGHAEKASFKLVKNSFSIWVCAILYVLGRCS